MVLLAGCDAASEVWDVSPCDVAAILHDVLNHDSSLKGFAIFTHHFADDMVDVIKLVSLNK